MRDIIHIQIHVATGRFTLPVTAILCLALWAVAASGWNHWLSLCICAAVGYLMIEANTAFTLIPVRTALPVCICCFLWASLCFLHAASWEDLVPLAFVTAVYQLFRSYESGTSATWVYNAFLALGLGSLALPQMVWYVPLMLLSMIPFRAMNAKSFWAALLGLFTPYWFILGYAMCYNRMDLPLEQLQETVHFSPVDFSPLPIVVLVSWAVITLLQLTFSIHYLQNSYIDKTRTRICHTFLVYAGGLTALFALLQPVHLTSLLPIQIICTAFLGGHLFSLTRNRFSGILFIVTFASIIVLTVYNLWMHFFNS